MNLAKEKEKKRIRKAAIPLLALLMVSLTLSTTTVSAVNVYQINNTFYDPNYETNPGVFEDLIDPWDIHASHSGGYLSYVGPTALICYPNEGIDHSIPKTSLPSEFNISTRMYFLSWPTSDPSPSSMCDIYSNGWNTAGSGYCAMYFRMNLNTVNNSYRFYFSDGFDTGASIYITDSPASKVYTLTLHFLYNTTSNYFTYDYSLCVEASTTEPGDETYYNRTAIPQRYGFADTVYIRLGGYSEGQYSSPGYTWIKFAKMWWDNGITPEPVIPEEQSVVISNLVKQIVFFIPILVLTSLFGRIGFMGGVGLMSVIWIFSNADFVASGLLMFIALGIFVYKGGMQ